MMTTLPKNRTLTATNVTERMANGPVTHTDHAILVCSSFVNQPLVTLETTMDKSTKIRLLTRITIPFDSL